MRIFHTPTVLVAVLLLTGVACDAKPKISTMSQDSEKEIVQKPDFDAAAPATEKEIREKNTAADAAQTQDAIEQYKLAERGISKAAMPYGSLSELLNTYKEQNLSDEKSAPKRPSTVFNAKNFLEIVEHLKKASAVNLTGDFQGLNAVGKKLTEKAEAFAGTLETLNEYFVRKDYMGDKFAKAREIDPLFVQQADAFIEAYNAFAKESAEIDILQNKKLVDELLQKGDLRQAYSFESYGYALRFLNIASFTDVKEPKTEEELAQQISKMNESLTKMREANSKIKDIKSSKYSSAEESLSQLLLSMREAKAANYDQPVMTQFVKKYNYFVRHTLNLGMLN